MAGKGWKGSLLNLILINLYIFSLEIEFHGVSNHKEQRESIANAIILRLSLGQLWQRRAPNNVIIV